jgi:hypothetical protein
MKEVFLSRPNWIPNTFEKGINNFYNLLKSIELNPRTIGQSDFPNESPLNEVINLMAKCEGTIVLGIPQIEIDNGNIKGTNINNKIILGTEWNHIEAALAYSIGHPLLIIHHKNVSRGIFDRGTCNSFLYEVDMDDSSWAISHEISGVISNWKSKLTTPVKSIIKENNAEIKPTLKWGMYKFEGEQGLFCPSCYQKEGLKIPCTRLNSKFYQCPSCNAKLG